MQQVTFGNIETLTVGRYGSDLLYTRNWRVSGRTAAAHAASDRSAAQIDSTCSRLRMKTAEMSHTHGNYISPPLSLMSLKGENVLAFTIATIGHRRRFEKSSAETFAFIEFFWSLCCLPGCFVCPCPDFHGGVLPPALGNLKMLEHLIISENKLTGKRRRYRNK